MAQLSFSPEKLFSLHCHFISLYAIIKQHIHLLNIIISEVKNSLQHKQ